MHTPTRTTLEVWPATLITLATDGVIKSIHKPDFPDYEQALIHARQQPGFHEAPEGCAYVPGMVDLHIHAPQWPQLGKSLHLPLEEWLQNCTFPLEARYADLNFADTIYTSLVQSLLANGTTSAVYFATVHTPATQLLAQRCLEKGQRAWVGRVAMDEASQCPDYYRDLSTEQGLLDTEQSINTIRSMPGNSARLVQPIITPRFIPSCTDEMLKGLGQLAQTHQCHVQTHCSESDWEHHYVLARCGQSDTSALQNFGLLTDKTVLAHANFISDDDMQIIKKRQSGIAHCPLSNQYFANSVFPLRKALDKGVQVGLGTDISGGPSASQFDSCRHVISASRMLESGTNPDIPADSRGVAAARSDFIEAFYLATTAGGIVLDEPIGQFREGYKFDALQIDTTRENSNLHYFPELDSQEDLFQKIVYATTIENIVGVWVDGVRRV